MSLNWKKLILTTAFIYKVYTYVFYFMCPKREECTQLNFRCVNRLRRAK